MSPSATPAATPASTTVPIGRALTYALAWIVPGGGHFLHGQTRKALVFFVVLVTMFWIGLDCGGRLFAFEVSDPLVGLACLAEWAIGLPRIVGAMSGWGRGDVVATTYEYGNTFLIVAGLLNTLVVLDAGDLAAGSKRR